MLRHSHVYGARLRAKLGAAAAGVALLAGVACDDDNPVDPPQTSAFLQVLGNGRVAERYTAEVWVRGNIAYTTTWGFRPAPGNAVKIWDVSGGGAPVLVDSLIVPNAVTLGDVQTSDDGALLVVATEFEPGSIMIYDLADPVKPRFISRFTSAATNSGVHTAEVQRVNGRLYAFLSVDPPARLVIVDITDPAAPVEVYTAPMGEPFLHDVFVRDGILFTALWDGGLSIWDIGGAGSGSVTAPRLIGNVRTVGGQVHNIWWYHSASGERRYAFVGEEGPGSIGAFSSGDIHVVDVSDMASPREVAFYRLGGAGTHNFSVDETRGLLYAAYYNGGVRVLDINGDLSSCSQSQRSIDGRCDLGLMGREVANGLSAEAPVYVWGVHVVGGKVYASDMLNGLWALREFNLPD
ncbi:MAG TPA: hypothetical protein VFS56_00655 [Gemmatimonadaceae bacterium]|nr:hypothetical protein [Gemmatimonadaceae bacterium]